MAASNLGVTPGYIGIGAQFTGDSRQVQADPGGLVGIESDTHFVGPATESANPRHAGNPFQACDNRVIHPILVDIDRDIVAFGSRNREPADHPVKTEAADPDHGFVGIDRIPWHLVQAVHDLDERPVHIGADSELQGNRGAAVGCL